MDTIKIALTIEEANIILAALGQQPYLKVAGLIQKIQEEGASQLQKGSPEELEQASISNSHHNGTGKLARQENEK